MDISVSLNNLLFCCASNLISFTSLSFLTAKSTPTSTGFMFACFCACAVACCNDVATLLLSTFPDKLTSPSIEERSFFNCDCVFGLKVPIRGTFILLKKLSISFLTCSCDSLPKSLAIRSRIKLFCSIHILL